MITKLKQITRETLECLQGPIKRETLECHQKIMVSIVTFLVETTLFSFTGPYKVECVFVLRHLKVSTLYISQHVH